MRSLLVLALTCLMAAAVSAGTCTLHSSCSGCTTDASHNCGWEADYQTCVAGSSSGPRFGFSASWIWRKQGCPSQDTACSRSVTCDGCTSDYPYCGWDGFLCRSGTSSGPSYGSSEQWYWYNCPNGVYWGVSSWRLWTTVCTVFFFVAVFSACCYRRRRRVAVVVVNEQQYQQPFAQQAAAGQPAYGQPQQQYGTGYGVQAA